MRRTDFVLSCLALVGCTSSRPEPGSTQPVALLNEDSGPTCAQEAEALHVALLRIDKAAGPRVAPGPVAPWPVALAPHSNFALFLRHERGQWRNDPFDPDGPEQVEAAYVDAQERPPGSEGFLLAADPATPTREVAARLVALEHANITFGSFNVSPCTQPRATASQSTTRRQHGHPR